MANINLNLSPNPEDLIRSRAWNITKILLSQQRKVILPRMLSAADR